MTKKTPPRRKNSPTAMTYKDAGVNIQAGNDLIKAIQPLTKATARQGADGALGGFAGLFDLKRTSLTQPLLVAATDGVGTKLSLAKAMKKHDTIGIDLVAMCANDVVVQGAEPLFFLDYFATGKLEKNTAKEVITGIAAGCEDAQCALIGGETAEMPGFYPKGSYDLAGFCVGAVEHEKLLPRDTIAEGDSILGLGASGIHSNGFSFVQHLLKSANLSYQDAFPPSPSQTVGEVLLQPTRIYVRALLQLFKKFPVKACAHITGGGIEENLVRALAPSSMDGVVDFSTWPCPPVFSWLENLGLCTKDEFRRVFNCGLGMMLVVDKAIESAVVAALKQLGETVYVVGHTTRAKKGKCKVRLI